MEINNFTDLTEFLGEEYTKNADNFKVVKPSNKMVNFVEKETIKYAKAYAKPLLKSEKRRIKLWEAIDTMPHGFWWKLFHSNLWAKIKMLEDEKNLKSVKEEVRTQIEETIKCYPVMVQPASVPEVFEEDDDEQEE